MTTWRLALRSLTHHWRTDGAVALGVMAAAAVLTGALLVGDSVRGSLRHLILDRLGRIDDALVVDRMFRAEMTEQLQAAGEFKSRFATAAPAIVIEGTLEAPDGGARANRVNVFGVDPEFWKLGSGGPKESPTRGEIVLNEPVAEQLGAKAGDELILRLPQASQIPPDSPLGRKTETIRSQRLRIAEVIPAAGLGRFGLRPNQQLPLDAFVAVGSIQAALDQAGRVNAIVVAGKSTDVAPSAADTEALNKSIRPQLADYGLELKPTPLGYFNLTSQRMLLDKPVVQAVTRAYPHSQLALTYLANTIAAGEREIPYSTIAALDLVGGTPLGPFESTSGQAIERIGDGEIVLNDWAASDIQARPGDKIRITYFKPESTHGQTEEETVELTLADVVRLTGPAADPGFTPEVQGITDEASIADWDPPFPFDANRVRKIDEEYWDDHRGTPKAFVSLATGRRLWGSRFGDTTSIRIPAGASETAEQVAARIKIDPADLGFVFQPVKAQGLQAAAGTTPFNMLFIGFSLFIIVAALMLVTLLFRLTIEVRAREIGVLLAVGIPSRQVRRLWSIEGLLMAIVGAVVGAALGVGYAWLMLAGLNTWWVAAVTTPFVRLYVSPQSLAIGALATVLMSWVTMWWTLRRLRREPARQLLAGLVAQPPRSAARSSKVGLAIAVALVALAFVLALPATRLSGEAQAGAFMGSGALVLVGLMLLARYWLQRPRAAARGADSLPELALRSGARNPTRTMLTVGLVAAAVFIIVSISSFRLEPAGDTKNRATGTGGFALVADASQPIYENVSDAPALDLSPRDERVLAQAKVYEIRVHGGDDASCLNLYQTRQPRVLGVPESFIERGGFQWAGTLAGSEPEQANPWLLLDKDWGQTGDGRAIMPVVIDAATAMYSLHLSGAGATYELPRTEGPAIPCLVVGLLRNSVLQGDLITSERRLLKEYPGTSGHQLFLIDADPKSSNAIAQILERRFGDYGFDAQSAAARLAGYQVVQNTYLSTFQSLGGLGLLLGTLGLAIVELRSVLERRGELALFRAVGFRRRMLASLVFYENLLILVAGLAIGLVAALVAVSPHMTAGDATVPWGSLFVMLGTIVVVGLAAGALAMRAVTRAPLVAALRGD